jgi:hypothetical protein
VAVSRTSWLAAAAVALSIFLPVREARALETWLFQRRAYFTPALSDPRAAILKIAFPARAASVPFAEHARPGTVWDITMGQELPLVGVQTSTLAGEWLDAGHLGAGLWLPVGFHMIEDLGKDRSNPVLNVDYRFGLMAKAQLGLPWAPAGDFTGSVVAVQVHVGHESTHVGDEFTLNALDAYGDAFRRVNVSYQFVEPGVMVGVRWPTWRGRLLARCLFVAFTGSDSWYSPDLEQPRGAMVAPSRRNYEPSLSVEATTEWPWRPFLSLDLRPRTVYDYDRASGRDGEGFQWSVNALGGIRPPAETWGGLTHLYLRAYYGVNPAGQFREQRDWWLLGLGLAFFHEDR